MWKMSLNRASGKVFHDTLVNKIKKHGNYFQEPHIWSTEGNKSKGPDQKYDSVICSQPL